MSDRTLSELNFKVLSDLWFSYFMLRHGSCFNQIHSDVVKDHDTLVFYLNFVDLNWNWGLILFLNNILDHLDGLKCKVSFQQVADSSEPELSFHLSVYSRFNFSLIWYGLIVIYWHYLYYDLLCKNSTFCRHLVSDENIDTFKNCEVLVVS